MSPSLPPSTVPCSYFLVRKNRPCNRFHIQTHNPPLCGMHLPTTTKCPHCNTSLRPDILPKHIHTLHPGCPVLRRQIATRTQTWYKHACNRPDPRPHIPVNHIHIETIPDLVSQVVQKYHAEVLPEWVPCGIGESTCESDYVAAIWGDVRNSSVKMESKHFEQIRMLAHVLLEAPVLAPTAVVIVEIGAGRAYTSLYCAHVLERRDIHASFVAVDIAAVKFKTDAEVRVRSSGMRRIRCDLAHFWMPGVKEIAEGEDVRVIGKHVCGAALDMGLHAVIRFAKGRRKGSVRLVLASCCRSLCKYDNIGGGVLEEWRLNDVAFREVCRLATMGLGSGGVGGVGGLCRRFVDLARVEWLRREGWDAYVGSYTDAEIGSPESACIVAVWKGG